MSLIRNRILNLSRLGIIGRCNIISIIYPFLDYDVFLVNFVQIILTIRIQGENYVCINFTTLNFELHLQFLVYGFYFKTFQLLEV
jgi:hypothetical protein